MFNYFCFKMAIYSNSAFHLSILAQNHRVFHVYVLLIYMYGTRMKTIPGLKFEIHNDTVLPVFSHGTRMKTMLGLMFEIHNSTVLPVFSFNFRTKLKTISNSKFTSLFETSVEKALKKYALPGNIQSICIVKPGPPHADLTRTIWCLVIPYLVIYRAFVEPGPPHADLARTTWCLVIPYLVIYRAFVEPGPPHADLAGTTWCLLIFPSW